MNRNGTPAGSLANVTSVGKGHIKTDSFALFAQGTWHLRDRLDFTAGVRGTYEEKNASVGRNAPVGGVAVAGAAAGAAGGTSAAGGTASAGVVGGTSAPSAGGALSAAGSGASRDNDLDVGLELYALYVRSSAYGAGVGYALFEQVVGDRACSLWVLAGNERAVGFYERQGFRLDGTEDEHDEGLHVRMVRAGT